MTAQQITLALTVALAVVLLVRWAATRSARRPDDSMAQFSRALDALRPADDPVQVLDVDDTTGAERGRGPAAGAASSPNSGRG